MLAGKRFLFLHVPKQAGSSCGPVFSSLDEGRPPAAGVPPHERERPPGHGGLWQLPRWRSRQLRVVCSMRTPRQWYPAYYYYWHSSRREVRCETLRQFFADPSARTEPWDHVVGRMLRPWLAPTVRDRELLHYHGARSDADRRLAYEVVRREEISLLTWQLVHTLRLDPASYRRGAPVVDPEVPVTFLDVSRLDEALSELFGRPVLVGRENENARADCLDRPSSYESHWSDSSGRPTGPAQRLAEQDGHVLALLQGAPSAAWEVSVGP